MGNIFLERFWSQTSKLFAWNEIWYLHYFEGTEFIGDVYFFWFRLEIPSLGKFVPNRETCKFKIRFDTKFMILNLIPNLILRFDAEFIKRLNFSVYDMKYPFWANFVPKFKIVCLKWNLVPRLIRICRIHWWCSLFLF